jgi:hypothetical protein
VQSLSSPKPATAEFEVPARWIAQVQLLILVVSYFLAIQFLEIYISTRGPFYRVPVQGSFIAWKACARQKVVGLSSSIKKILSTMGHYLCRRVLQEA